MQQSRNMPQLVTARNSALPDDSIPDEIVFIPEGEQRLTPGSHPKGVRVNLPADKGEAIAANFQAQLTKALTNNVKPWFDFEHTRKSPAAGYPTAFRYEQGRGIIASVAWSGKGRRELEEKNVRFFSPEFYIDGEGLPTGFPDRGPIGGLVAEPAFREIPPIAASDASENDETKPHTPSMKRILASLKIDDAHLQAEDKAVEAIAAMQSDSTDKADKLKSLEDKIKELQAELAAAKNSVTASNKKRAEDLVAIAASDGRIAPKDEEKKAKFIERITAGDAFAEEMLASLPKQAGPDKQIITSGQRVTAGASDFEQTAAQLVTAGRAKTIDEAYGIVASEKPELYDAYNESLRA